VIDVTQMSMAEVLAEKERREALRAAGRPLSDPPHLEVAFGAKLKTALPGVWLQEVETSWIATDETFRRLSLPWSTLVPDNERTQPVIRGGKPFMVLTGPYKAAKKKARGILCEQCGGLAPLEGRIQVVATLFEPNRSSRRDVSNYEKLVHDALTGLAYVDDSQIDDLRWRRGQTCIDRPRLEISVTELYA
jgi:Holliday junction resolvase RusA-like endonuclease